jgi:DMSO/TMAO reductase YedYZ heme-binding membrane subunit
VEEPNEAVAERTPQPRWIGFVAIVVLVVLALTVLPTVRRRIKRFMGA